MMVNVTHPFNSTGEFWSQVFSNFSYATGDATITGILLSVIGIFVIYRVGGEKAAFAGGIGIMLLFSKVGLLPEWLPVVAIMVVALAFAIFNYDRLIAARR